jgi:hypothetical protein
MRRALLLAGVAAALAVPAASAMPAPAAALRVAKAHVVAGYRIGALQSVVSLRSVRDPRWALVDGYYGKPKRSSGPGLWAVWLRLSAGRWVVRYSGLDARAIRPPARLKVPCDLRPAFAEPSCR